MDNSTKPFAKLASALGRAINEIQEAAGVKVPEPMGYPVSTVQASDLQACTNTGIHQGDQPQFTTRSIPTMVAHTTAPWATLDPHGNLLTLNQELMEQYAAQGDSTARVALAIQAHTRKENAQ